MRFRILTADDIFISYSHSDGGTYALGLADELTKRGFSCFVDQFGTEPSKGLPTPLRRKIRRCAMLVIISTDDAGSRRAIEDEIKEFLNSGRRASIVPVDFEGAIYKARWYSLVEGVPIETEKELAALGDGNPSPSVVGRIEKQFSYKRRNQRLRQITFATSCLVTFLVGVAIVATIVARQKIALANWVNAQATQARLDEQVARRDEAAARESEARANELKAKADVEANDKQMIAKTAVQRETEANKAASKARAETQHQQAISDSLLLANESRRTLARSFYSIPSSVSLAVQALDRFPTVEADSALRESLSLLPHRERSEHYTGEILDAQLSPDGRHLGTLSWDNIIRVYRLGHQQPIREFDCRSRKSHEFDLRRRLITLSSDAAFAAVVSGNDAIVIDLNAGRSHTIRLVEAGFSPDQIALSPNGKYLALVYGRATPFFSSARVLNATSGQIIKSFAEDLDIMAEMISFGPNGDLVLVGRLLVSTDIQTGQKVLPDSWSMIVWPLSAKQKERESGRELTAEDFGRGIEKRIPTPRGVTPLTPSEGVAIGPTSLLIAWGDVVYQLNGNGEYAPLAYLPYTNSTVINRSSERRYAFNREGTQVIVVTAKSFASSTDWLRNWTQPPDANWSANARNSRSSWSVEWWDLGDILRGFCSRSQL